MSVRIPTFEQILAVSQSRGGRSYAPGLWDGLVGAWPLQEGGGLTAFDASGYGNHGTLTNMDPATDHVVTEKGRALDFDGTNDYVAFPQGRIKPITGLSMSAWVRTANSNDIDPIVSWDDSSSKAWYLYFKDSGSVDRIAAWVDGVLVSINYTAGTFPPNVWHHVAGTWDGALIRLYLDGVEIANGAKTGDITYSVFGLQQMVLHYYGDGATYREGQTTNVLIAERAFSAGEIAQLYADPWAMYRQRRRLFAARAAAPAGNRRRRFLMVGADT